MPPRETSAWRKLPTSLTELSTDTTLRCGQSFRWRKMSDQWHCTLRGRIISLRQDDQSLHYRAIWPEANTAALTPPLTGASTPVESPTDDTESLLKNYFNLHYDLSSLYKQWSDVDANFRKRAPYFTGIRILNQDAWEALVGFICSSNNNISRISQMVHKLCLHYGPYIGKIDEEPFHDFPTPSSLAVPGVEAHLRALGFGYRARFIAETARNIANERPQGWLLSLRNPDSIPLDGTSSSNISLSDGVPKPSYKHAQEQLLQLTGVGPKVADCVCLMGLGWLEAVPVDTHVWQIAMRDYKFGGKMKSKTINKSLYDAVGDHFRSLWGSQAGWAHSVLFAADLKSFKEQLAAKLAEKTEDDPDMNAVKVETKDEDTTDIKATKVEIKDEDDTDLEAVKMETKDDVALVAPAITPATRKRKSAVVTETVKVEVKEEDDPGMTAVETRRSKRTRKGGLR